MEKMIFAILDDREEMCYENDFYVIITTEETWRNKNRIDDGSTNYPEAYELLRDLGFVDVVEGSFDAQLCETRENVMDLLESHGFLHDAEFEKTMIEWDEEARAEEEDDDEE